MAAKPADLEEALKKISSCDKKEAGRGIEVALGIESESIAFYEKQADDFKGRETEHFFNFLAKQERKHFEAISSLKETLEKEGKWIPQHLGKESKPKLFSKKDWDKGVEDGLRAVLFAMWKEKQAQEFYEAIALRLKDKGAISFFQELAKFEKGHAELLSEYVDESYYANELVMG